MTLNSEAKLWPCRPWRIGATFSGGLKARKLCVMTLKGDAKFKGKLTRGLKNDWKNLVSFHASSRSLKICTLMCCFAMPSTAYKVSAKKVQKNSLMILRKDPNFEELAFRLKNDMRNLMNFNASSEKSENLLLS